MTSILKTLIIVTLAVLVVTLAALIVMLANDNRELQTRNDRLERNIRAVVMNKNKRCLGYIEPGKIVKELYVRKLTRSKK
jgi:hypothetical protein